ncbi:MAG: GNAT family N-acetyltransferase [Treponema sp.]|jgi:ribosomal protein S18 acetylase RimI-like enzyme|nr:GNAT family N-acetyltransferase [Treponema sp.]
MAVFIRPACGSDIPYLYEICLKTGDSGKDASGLFHDPLLLGQYYGAPYFFYDPSLCFVAEDQGIPQGYILAAAETRDFNRWMEQVWLPPLRRRYPEPYPRERIKSPFEQHLVLLLHQSLESSEPGYWSSYPAHLHIDLLPAIQGQGVGKMLMHTLLDALDRRNCPGVHLGLSKSNTRALAFYQKEGFSELQAHELWLVLGKSRVPIAP